MKGERGFGLIVLLVSLVVVGVGVLLVTRQILDVFLFRSLPPAGQDVAPTGPAVGSGKTVRVLNVATGETETIPVTAYDSRKYTLLDSQQLDEAMIGELCTSEVAAFERSGAIQGESAAAQIQKNTVYNLCLAKLGRGAPQEVAP